MFNDLFLGGGENRSVYEIMWKNMVEPERPQMTNNNDVQTMRFACQVTKATVQTHSSE